MTFNPVPPLNSVENKERLLKHVNRQQARNRQRAVLMRTMQQIAPD